MRHYERKAIFHSMLAVQLTEEDMQTALQLTFDFKKLRVWYIYELFSKGLSLLGSVQG